MNYLEKTKPLLQSAFRVTESLKDQIKEDFNRWITSLNEEKAEDREKRQQQIYLQAEMILRREDLSAKDRREIEIILKIVE